MLIYLFNLDEESLVAQKVPVLFNLNYTFLLTYILDSVPGIKI